jgi:hypothetical protein
MLVRGGIQAVLLQMLDLGSRGHGALLQCFPKTPSLVQRSNDSKKINWGQIPINFRLIDLNFK